MKDEIFGLLSFGFLGLGFFFPEKPIFSIGCFLAFAIFALLQVSVEAKKERRIFKK